MTKQRFSLGILGTLALLGCGGGALAACVGDAPAEITVKPLGPDTVDPGKDAGPETGNARWTPSDLPGLTLWLDGTDATSVVRADGGTGVVQWNDKSPQGREPFKTASSAAPVFTSSAIGNKTGIAFGDGDNRAYLSGPALTDLTAAEAFIVLRTSNVDTADSGVKQFGLWKFGTAYEPDLYPNEDNRAYGGFGTNTRPLNALNTQTEIDLTAPHIYDTVSSYSEWSASFDGVEVFKRTSNTVDFGKASPNPVSLLGASSRDNFQPLWFFRGVIGEILVFNRPLEKEERAQLNTHLSAKWGVPLK